MDLRRQGEFRAALAVVAVAVGTDFATGRELSAFYAQTGPASWLGVALSGTVFGLLTAMLARLARRSGADSLPALLGRMPGGRMGKGAAALYALVVVLACAGLLSAAGHMGALALPLRGGGCFGAAFALLSALWIAFMGMRALAAAGSVFVGCVALFELGLMFFGRAPEPAALRFELELRLYGNIAAALTFALLHACVCACVAAGCAVRLSHGRVRPGRLGLWSGALFMLLLLAGNAALALQPEELLALKLPFVALASGWGKVGFYLSSLISYFAAVTTLAGLAGGLIPRKMMLNYENPTSFD